MHRRLQPRSSVDRLCMPRAQGGRRLLSVKDCVELERSNLFGCAANNNERLLKAATEELQLRTKIDWKNKEERKNERHAAWKEKALHGQFLRETEAMQDQRRWKALYVLPKNKHLEQMQLKMTLITRTCPRYAGPAKRKLKVSPILSVCVLS